MAKTQNWALQKTFSDYKADRRICTFEGVDAQKRVTLTDARGNLATIITDAMSVTLDDFSATIDNIYSNKAFSKGVRKSAYERMSADIFNVLRAYKPQDDDYSISTNGHESECNGAYAHIVARHVRDDKKGVPHVVGIRVEFVTFGHMCTIDLATDRKQQIQPRKWGFYAFFKAFIERPLAEMANDESRKLRDELGAFVRVGYELRKLTEGYATIKTDEGENAEYLTGAFIA